MIDDHAVLPARVETLEKENAALLLLLEKQGIARHQIGESTENQILSSEEANADQTIDAQPVSGYAIESKGIGTMILLKNRFHIRESFLLCHHPEHACLLSSVALDCCG